MSSPIAAIPAPEGYIVNFDNPARYEDITGYWAFGVGTVLSFSFLCMRIYTKVVVSRSFAAEDVMWLYKAMGVHAWEIPIERYHLYGKLIMSSSVIYVACLGLSKFSLLLFYNRLSPVQWFRNAVYFLMFVVLGHSIALIFALIFLCQPLAMNWEYDITDGTCIDRTAIFIATAALNVATDIALLALVIPMIMDLQMPRIQKVGLIVIFMVGSLTCVTSMIRLKIMLPLLIAPDQTWAVSVPCIWIIVEANLVIVCGSFPIILQFAKHVAPNWVGETTCGSLENSGSRLCDLETIGQKSSKKKRFRYGIDSLDDHSFDLKLDGRCVEHRVEITAIGRALTRERSNGTMEDIGIEPYGK
ncbi:hypothetical protein BofuT4_P014340.1 [Botrytis cinerea T4]|uniref:Rhodopsin domain-containing protein n=1 Tax=Botryotinia fuckeliana (strain T4) TaxID=999810 RepID=G2XN50_BOTF4|nr:hypothetical protein BofuT4_P014340.1 [Botrytis cinerea T4]